MTDAAQPSTKPEKAKFNVYFASKTKDGQVSAHMDFDKGFTQITNLLINRSLFETHYYAYKHLDETIKDAIQNFTVHRIVDGEGSDIPRIMDRVAVTIMRFRHVGLPVEEFHYFVRRISEAVEKEKSGESLLLDWTAVKPWT
ncbi:MAG: hypothetical protein Q9199_001503 [Rusavskia elegans]